MEWERCIARETLDSAATSPSKSCLLCSLLTPIVLGRFEQQAWRGRRVESSKHPHRSRNRRSRWAVHRSANCSTVRRCGATLVQRWIVGQQNDRLRPAIWPKAWRQRTKNVSCTATPKPENAFVTSDGGIKSLDFGLAKLTETLVANLGASLITSTPTPPDAETTPGLALRLPCVPCRLSRCVASPLINGVNIFSFGAILMKCSPASGRFEGDTPAQI